MTVKYKNIVIDKIKELGSITDKTLAKKLVKDGYHLSDDLFNKILLDMEIMGLINVNWLTKDTRRIAIVSKQEEEDDVEMQNKKTLEKDYENSFPESNNGV
uniref:Uncharacterized protein n=4 Tax=environmental samples TaxID=651140 RepID=A0A075GXC7_9ARCH|nr:hypothetical protein [uncultured marine thaumarchaeote KM3_162_H04]AIF08464.1 hypothetical protein [uncultured marine thaumarchaeote KM3_30_B02]AIF08474.1 hypothetical protein [uncultured marine thaumarchaeote KM3_30_B03]AIF18941.1 hypothetical protein [uncultured marine thaumarchaeote KM3_85_A07]